MRSFPSTTSGYYGEQHLPQSALQMGYSNQPVQGTQGYYPAQQQQQQQQQQQHQQPPQGSTYGYVNYPANQVADGGSHTNMEAQSQGFTALNNFYYDTRRGTFDPRSYSQVENRIMTIQAGGLPFIGHGGISEQHVGHGHVGGGGVGGGAQTTISSQFQLPALDHLRTKNDLLHADRVMEQAQATIYDRPGQMAAAGVGQLIQPEAYHIRNEINIKHHMRVQSEAPKSQNLHHQQQAMHYGQSAPIANSSNHHTHTYAAAAESPPALTPANSSQSYPSNSPVSPQSNLSVSPIATHSAPAVYPNLASSTSNSANSESIGIYNLGMNNGIGMASGTTTLAGQCPGGDARHRYGGGYLRRGRPLQLLPPGEEEEEIKQDDSPSSPTKEKALDEDMESSDESTTTMARSRRSSTFSKSPPAHHPSISIISKKKNILLDRSKTKLDSASLSSSPGTSLSSPTSTSTNGGDDDSHDPIWLGIVRTLEDLRDWIRKRLENGEFEEKGDDDIINQDEVKIKLEELVKEEECQHGRRGGSEKIGSVQSEAVYPILGEARG